METDFPAVDNCFGYTLLQRLLSHTEDAQEHMLELGNIIVFLNVKTKTNHGHKIKHIKELSNYTSQRYGYTLSST